MQLSFPLALTRSLPTSRSRLLLVISPLLYEIALGHIAAFHRGMYCLNGTVRGVDNQNTADAVNPLYQLPMSDWWFHHVNHCDEYPPDEGDYLELHCRRPANGVFTVELAVNRAFTTLSYNGSQVGEFGNGDDQPDIPEVGPGEPPACISEPNIHTQNESMAAGTAFAISYQSELSRVTRENLVVFTVLYHTPWKRLATYSVPNLTTCPDGGCICAWGWVANGCGEPNMYMQGSRCKVTGDAGSRAIASGRPAVWCEDDPGSCVRGPRQMIYWNQQDGNNVFVHGFDQAGHRKSPTYNERMGFIDGAQHDIFEDDSFASKHALPSVVKCIIVSVAISYATF